jgi:hypothetical protein
MQETPHTVKIYSKRDYTSLTVPFVYVQNIDKMSCGKEADRVCMYRAGALHKTPQTFRLVNIVAFALECCMSKPLEASMLEVFSKALSCA